MNISSISTDVIGIIALLFTISLAKRNIVINNHKTKIYILTSYITIVVLTLEIFDTLIQVTNNINNFLVLFKIINVIGFSLTPLIPFMLLFLNDNKIPSHITLHVIPLSINAVISILSYKTGWIFFCNAQGQYVRGSHFFIIIAISAFYYILLMISIIRNDSEYDKEDLTFLKLVFWVPILAVIFQNVINGFYIIWAGTALALLLYYIFLRELQFKYDVISGIKNRKAFENEMERYNINKNDVAIVVLDLNDLKKINDTRGHKAGDEAIAISGSVLQESFKGIGKAYRIGGDEFCVLCNNTTKEIIENALFKLNELLDILNQNRDIKVVLAYGYEIYKKDQNRSIYDVFSIADKLMYEQKAKQKGCYGRRIDDN